MLNFGAGLLGVGCTLALRRPQVSDVFAKGDEPARDRREGEDQLLELICAVNRPR